MEGLNERYPQLVKSLEKYWTEAPRQRPPQPAAAANAAGAPRRRFTSSTEPFMNAVYEAAQYVDGTDPNFTFIVYKPGEARDLPVMLHGNVATPGDVAPRGISQRAIQGRYTIQEGIRPPRISREDLFRRSAARCPRDRQSRLGLAFRQTARRRRQAISERRVKSRRIRSCLTT